MAIIIPTSCPSPPPTIPPPVFSGPLPNPQRSAFLFPSVRFFVSSNLLSRSLRSAILFPLVRYPVSFGPPSCSLRFACLFLLVRFPVPFVPLLRFFRSASPFLLYPAFVSFVLFPRFLRSALSFSSVRFLFLLVRFYGALCRSQVFSLLILSLPFCQVFSSLSNPIHAFQC